MQFAALSETGQYLVIISGRDASVPRPVAYEWTISPANDGPVISSGFDVLYQGTAGEGDVVATFQGNAGSRILFQSQIYGIYLQNGGFYPANVRIVGPSGETVAQTSYPGASPYQFVLPRSGQYTAKIVGQYAPLTSTVQYLFSLSEISSLTRLDLGTTYPVQAISRDFTAPFAFEGTAGQQVLVDLMRPDNHDDQYDRNYLTMTVEAPDGTAAYFGSPLPLSGTYLVLISVGYTYGNSPYSIRLLSVDAAPKLPRDTAFTGTNAHNYEDVVRRFDVRAGEKLLLQADSINIWSIVDPAGLEGSIAWNRVETTPGTSISEGLVEFPHAGTMKLTLPQD